MVIGKRWARRLSRKEPKPFALATKPNFCKSAFTAPKYSSNRAYCDGKS